MQLGTGVGCIQLWVSAKRRLAEEVWFREVAVVSVSGAVGSAGGRGKGGCVETEQSHLQ